MSWEWRSCGAAARGGAAVADLSSPPLQVQDFRRNVLNVCELAVNERTFSNTAMVKYCYPPVLVSPDGRPLP